MSDNPFEPNQRLLSSPSPRTSSSSYGGNTEAFAQGGGGVSGGGGGNSAFSPELNFQNFQHTTVSINDPGNNKIGGSAILQEEHPVDFSDEHVPQQGPTTTTTSTTQEPPNTANLHFWNLQYYSPLFNVDTKEVTSRILRSMLPFKFSFIETAKSNPDFYGPFWISTTLIFILAVAGNLYSYLKINNTDDWHYDFNLVTVGAVAIYGYVMVIPLLLWLALKWLKVPLKLLETVCIYGYSIFIYIPVSIICVIPIGLMQWILVCAAAALSGWFLVSNLMVPIKNASQTKQGIIILVIVGAFHVGLALLYRLYFFAKSL